MNKTIATLCLENAKQVLEYRDLVGLKEYFVRFEELRVNLEDLVKLRYFEDPNGIYLRLVANAIEKIKFDLLEYQQSFGSMVELNLSLLRCAAAIDWAMVIYTYGTYFIKVTLKDIFDEVPEVTSEGFFKLTNRIDGQAYGLKRIKVDNQAERLKVMKKVDILMKMRHPNIAKCYYCFDSHQQSYLNIIFENPDGGALEDRVDDSRVTVHAITEWLSQVTSAMMYLHYDKNMYNTVMPENIMLTSDERIKLVCLNMNAGCEESDEINFGAHSLDYNEGVDVRKVVLLFCQVLLQKRLSELKCQQHDILSFSDDYEYCENLDIIKVQQMCIDTAPGVGSLIARMLHPLQLERCTVKDLAEGFKGLEKTVPLVKDRRTNLPASSGVKRNASFPRHVAAITMSFNKCLDSSKPSKWSDTEWSKACQLDLDCFIGSISLSSDCNRMAVSTENFVSLYEIQKIDNTWTFKHKWTNNLLSEKHVRSVAFSHGGVWLVVGCDDCIAILEAATGNRLFNKSVIYYAHRVAYSKDDSKIVAAVSVSRYMVLDITGNEVAIHPNSIDVSHGLCLTADGTTLIGAGRSHNSKGDGICQISVVKGFDTALPTATTFQCHELPRICVNSTASKIIVGSASGEISVYTRNCTGDGYDREIFTAHDNSIFSLCMSPDDSFFVSGSADKTVRVWDVNTLKCLCVFHGHTSCVTSVRVGSDGTIISSSYGMVLVWRPAIFNSSKTGNSSSSSSIFSAVTSKESSVTAKPHSRGSESSAYLSADSEGEYSPEELSGDDIKDRSNRAVVNLQCQRSTVPVNTNWKTHIKWKFETYVGSISYNSDCSTLVANGGAIVRLYDLQTKRVVWMQNTISRKTIRSVSFSPVDQILAVGSDDKVFRLVNAKNGRVINAIKVNGFVHRVCWSPNGTNIAVAVGERRYAIIDKLGHELFERKSIPRVDASCGLCFSENEGMLIAAGGGYITVIDDFIVVRGRIKCDAHRICIHSSGNMVYAGTSDGHLVTYSTNINSLSSQRVLPCDYVKAHKEAIKSMFMAPNNEFLVTASSDRTIKVWDAVTVVCLQILKGHTDAVTSVRVGFDLSIISSSDDEMVRVWQLQPGALVPILFTPKVN